MSAAPENSHVIIKDSVVWNIGDRVFHKTGESPGLITGIIFRGSGGIAYEVTWRGRCAENHFDYELQKSRPAMEKTYEGEDE